MDNLDYSKYGGQIEEPEVDYSQYGGEVENQPNPMVDTFLGKMPSRSPEFEIGSPENKNLIESMIEMLTGSPGLKSTGAAISKGGSNLKNLVQSSLKDVKPYEEAAENAGKEYETASAEAEPVRPGIYTNPNSELESIEHEIGKHLNIKGQHDVRAAKAISNRVSDIEGFWGDKYKQFMDKIKESKFEMPKEAMKNTNYDLADIMSRIRSGANPRTVMTDIEKENENPFFKELMKSAPTSKDTNASSFLSKYKDFRDSIYGLKQDLKSDKYSSVEKQKINDAIKRASKVEGNIKQTLDEGLGEFKPEFDWINNGYSQQVFPLRNNPLVQSAKAGKLSSNIINSARTDEPGMSMVRDIIKQDPELLRNVVGQRYLKNPSEIHQPNELMNEFLGEMPELKNLIKDKEDLLSKTAKRKDISLKNKIEAERQLSEIKRSKSKSGKKLRKGIFTAAGLGGVNYGISGLSKLFMNNESGE